ncbi:hypothetical protein DPMN_000986 [Dreissena polymorpha]|uniref:Uncharacterized protein n=1 Tax=Dreissena polymorpha TaxID=45954 RepID=A0A9D4MJC4_DREPO|nr:hypothetical protein DPMN_000986 [Dreissena polymorpha]
MHSHARRRYDSFAVWRRPKRRKVGGVLCRCPAYKTRTYLVTGNQRQIDKKHAGQHEIVRSLVHGTLSVYPTSRRVKPTSSLEDDEDVWCQPDEDSSRCPYVAQKERSDESWPACRPNFERRYDSFAVWRRPKRRKVGGVLCRCPAYKTRTYLVTGNQRQIDKKTCWAARDSTVPCARDVECHSPTSVYPTSRRVKPTSSLEDDEDVWCQPDEDSSRCLYVAQKERSDESWPACRPNFEFQGCLASVTVYPVTKYMYTDECLPDEPTHDEDVWCQPDEDSKDISESVTVYPVTKYMYTDECLPDEPMRQADEFPRRRRGRLVPT